MMRDKTSDLFPAMIVAAVVIAIIISSLYFSRFGMDAIKDHEKTCAIILPDSAEEYLRCTQGRRRDVCLIMFPDNTGKFKECDTSRQPLSNFASENK